MSRQQRRSSQLLKLDDDADVEHASHQRISAKLAPHSARHIHGVPERQQMALGLCHQTTLDRYTLKLMKVARALWFVGIWTISRAWFPDSHEPHVVTKARDRSSTGIFPVHANARIISTISI